MLGKDESLTKYCIVYDFIEGLSGDDFINDDYY